MTTTERHDYLFFLYDGNYNCMRIVRNVVPDDFQAVCNELGVAEFQLNGAVQLAREQTHYKDTSIIHPTKFMVWTNDDKVMWLHDVEVFVRPNQPIEAMETAANQSLEDQLDRERADGEGMYVDESSDDISADPLEEAAEASGGDVSND